MFRERKGTGEKSKKMGTERTKRGNEYSSKNEYFIDQCNLSAFFCV